jgi:hypothetical protein
MGASRRPPCPHRTRKSAPYCYFGTPFVERVPERPCVAAHPVNHALARMYDVSMARNDSRHWRNGRWGRIARRDVYLRTEGDRCVVEAREGGPDGTVRTWYPTTHEDALLLVDDPMNDQDGWRELTVRP